jgi:hypothetical protein
LHQISEKEKPGIHIIGIGRLGKGILLDAGPSSWRSFYIRHRVLAHELGHYAGYDGGDEDGKAHSSKKNNIMHPNDDDGGTDPDSNYCEKVLKLAH